MSFFERARNGYESLGGRADQALDAATSGQGLGDIDQHYRDLGLLVYLASTGRPVDQATQRHLVGVLSAMEERGAIRDFVLHTTGRAPVGAPEAPQRPGGSDGVPQPPPERAGRHGDFLRQQRVEAPDQGYAPGPADGPPPPPSIGGTWGPPQQEPTGPRRWQPVRDDD